VSSSLQYFLVSKLRSEGVFNIPLYSNYSLLIDHSLFQGFVKNPILLTDLFDEENQVLSRQFEINLIDFSSLNFPESLIISLVI